MKAKEKKSNIFMEENLKIKIMSLIKKVKEKIFGRSECGKTLEHLENFSYVDDDEWIPYFSIMDSMRACVHCEVDDFVDPRYETREDKYCRFCPVEINEKLYNFKNIGKRE